MKDDTLSRIRKHRQLRRQCATMPSNVLPPRKITPEIEAVDALLSRACDEVTWSFVDRPPRTMKGAGALLRYAAELMRWDAWPDNREYFDNGPDLPWIIAVCEALGKQMAPHGRTTKRDYSCGRR
jgi:hypothetical protein